MLLETGQRLAPWPVFDSHGGYTPHPVNKDTGYIHNTWLSTLPPHQMSAAIFNNLSQILKFLLKNDVKGNWRHRQV
ncbi:hypothetical protein [Microbulbifer sp. GL-2]|uniref:hypothetical protein n=1 Tax=Microbulbifer sp. GL-2 TaxID=2591606 RepID=UPI0011630A1D|nr:hypothetical protein [Microbulbifer sp. GL-2]BBM01282.1 hypothetical protein GL2_13560 [Microbulbifer sp. GL-2]